jgi:hypothetical protein
MSLFPPIVLVASALILAGLSGTTAATPPMQPGLWELRVATIVAGRAVPASKSRECILQKDIDHETKTLPKPNGDCQVSNIDTVGDLTSYDLACKTGDTTSRGRMNLTIKTDSYDGKSNMLFSVVGSEDVPITIVVHAMRIGDCQK